MSNKTDATFHGRDLTPEEALLNESGFAAFLMTEFHEPYVAERIAREEFASAEAMGARVCPASRSTSDYFERLSGIGWHEILADGGPCAGCGATL